MQVGKVNGAYVLVNNSGRVFSTAHYTNFTRKLKEELDRAEIKTPAEMDNRESAKRITTDSPRGKRES